MVFRRYLCTVLFIWVLTYNFDSQVKRDFICLYCNERCHPFSSLEAVRKHMEAKSHCKVHYGDGSEDEEAELDEFYDYSSRFLFNIFIVFFFMFRLNLENML